MKIAFYKHALDGDLLDNAISAFSGFGPYSHVEIVFSDGISFSSTSRDAGSDSDGRPKPNGTRFKEIDYAKHPQRWTLIDFPVPSHVEFEIRRHARSLLDARYDFWGCARFVLPFIREHKDKFFCSEVTVHLLQHGGYLPLLVPHRVSPNALAKELSRPFARPRMVEK